MFYYRQYFFKRESNYCCFLTFDFINKFFAFTLNAKSTCFADTFSTGYIFIKLGIFNLDTANIPQLKGLGKRNNIVVEAGGIGVYRDAHDPDPNARFKAILMEIKADIEGGRQFSEAIAKHPKLFGPLYISMVKASEMSGAFARMLDQFVIDLQATPLVPNEAPA